MGKNKQKKHNEAGKQADKVGQHPSDKKLKRDGKPKKAKEGDHLNDIPFRLREIMKSKARMKMGNKDKKLKKALMSKHKQTQDGDIAVPHFKRKKQESASAYIRRMENEAKHVLFLTNNQVERRPELKPEKQEKPADKGKSEKRKEYDKVRLQKLQQKKLDRQVAELEKGMFVDNVPFGEVSMAPPSLSAKPRKSLLKPQTGTKDLLLNSLLGQTASSAKPSMAKQRIMEEERVRAVEAYRLLKKQKQQQHEDRTANLEKLTNPQ